MTTSKKRVEFAMCVANEGYDDLDIWKVYQVLPDAKAAAVGCLRVVDESGEDYLYPVGRFVSVDFPAVVRARLPRYGLDGTSERAIRVKAGGSRRRAGVSR